MSSYYSSASEKFKARTPIRFTATVVSVVITIALLTIAAAAQTSNQSDEANPTDPNPNSITGRVLTTAGQPVTNATVLVSRLNSPTPPRPVPTDNTGSFRVAGLEPGVFSITAYAASFVLPPADAETSQPTYYRIGDSVTVTMVKGGVVNGTVADSAGQPVVAVRVHAIMVRDANGQPANGGITGERLTDDRGVYRLVGLMPGTYVVSAGGGGGGG